MNKHKLVLTILTIGVTAGAILYAHKTTGGTAQTVCDKKDGKIVCRTSGGDSNSQQQATTACMEENGAIKCRSAVR